MLYPIKFLTTLEEVTLTLLSKCVPGIGLEPAVTQLLHMTMLYCFGKQNWFSEKAAYILMSEGPYVCLVELNCRDGHAQTRASGWRSKGRQPVVLVTAFHLVCV